MKSLVRRCLTSSSSHGGGLGVGNVRGVREQVLDLHASVIKAPHFLSQPATIELVGAPQQFGQPLAGTHRGPDLLRRFGLREMLTSLGWRIVDSGDVDMSSPGERREGKHESVVEAGSRRLYEACKAAHRHERLVLALGGDHSIALGSVAAALSQRPDTRILWVDAHADVNTPSTSPSGNMHGMPLGFLLGYATYDWLPTPLDPSRLAYVGLRDIDKDEKSRLLELRSRGAYVSTMREVDQFGVGKVMEMALDSLGYNDKTDDTPPPLHLSFDIDAIDPQFAAATGTVVRGGLSFREAHYICEAVWSTGALGSMDIVEVNDTLTDPDGAKETVDLAASLVASACGDVIL